MKIQVPLPANIEPSHQALFADKLSYSVSELKVNNIKNVFITHSGLCLKNGLLIKNCHFNLLGNEDSTFYFKFYKLALEQYLVSTYGKSLKKIHLRHEKYLHIYTKWFGYFFWLTDALPKLIKTQHLHKEVKLLYPQEWDKINFVENTLMLFPELQIHKIPSGVHVQVENLVLPETRQWSNAIAPNEVEMVRDFVSKQLDKKGINVNLGEKIYISRNRAARRKPVNNEEVEDVIKESGFKSVCMEDYSFLEQMSIIRNARFVVGLHGAGLANIVMMKKAGAVLEISPEVGDPSKIRIPFWRIANLVDSDFYIQFCKTHGNSTDVYDDNLYIDTEKLKKNLQLLTS